MVELAEVTAVATAEIPVADTEALGRFAVVDSLEIVLAVVPP